jgi:hypothetical protein
MLRGRLHFVFACAALFAAAGCRGAAPALESDAEVRDARERAKPGSIAAKVALAPVEVAYKPTGDLEKDSTRYPAKVDREQLRAALGDAIATSTSFPPPRAVAGPDMAASFGQAAASRDDVLVRPVLTRLDCAFHGHNWRWVPNMLLFFYAWVPSFWVPAEDFAYEGEMQLEFYSVASERLLYKKSVPIEVEWPLDHFERGWSWTGIVTAPKTMDADDWAVVSESLAPLGRYKAAKGAVLELAEPLPRYLHGEDFAAKDATVLALCVGVAREASARAAPEDARKMGTFLRERGGVPAKNVRVLAEEAATGAAVERALGELLDRSRPGDTILLYWSGPGAAAAAEGGSALTSTAPEDAPEAERYLLAYDADPAALARSALPLKRLRELIAKAPARRAIVLLDASFGTGKPGGRSIASAAAPRTDRALERFTERSGGKDITLYVSAAPGET